MSKPQHYFAIQVMSTSESENPSHGDFKNSKFHEIKDVKVSMFEDFSTPPSRFKLFFTHRFSNPSVKLQFLRLLLVWGSLHLENWLKKPHSLTVS
jgi:hypothetical protein